MLADPGGWSGGLFQEPFETLKPNLWLSSSSSYLLLPPRLVDDHRSPARFVEIAEAFETFANRSCVGSDSVMAWKRICPVLLRQIREASGLFSKQSSPGAGVESQRRPRPFSPHGEGQETTLNPDKKKLLPTAPNRAALFVGSQAMVASQEFSSSWQGA